eukprot:scaffold27465_cov59-Cyclotella_meneghiniana.AAC.4
MCSLGSIGTWNKLELALQLDGLMVDCGWGFCFLFSSPGSWRLIAGLASSGSNSRTQNTF